MEIAALGVGNGVSMANLRFGSFNKVFHFSNFKGLLDLITPDDGNREHSLQILPVNLINTRIAFKESLTIELLVKNSGHQILPTLDIRFSPPKVNNRIYFHESNAFVQKPLQPGEGELIRVTFNIGGAPFSEIPNEIPFKVYDLKTRKEIYCSPNSFSLSSGLFYVSFIYYFLIKF